MPCHQNVKIVSHTAYDMFLAQGINKNCDKFEELEKNIQNAANRREKYTQTISRYT